MGTGWTASTGDRAGDRWSATSLARIVTAVLAIGLVGWPVARLVLVAFEAGIDVLLTTVGGPLVLGAITASVWTSTVVAGVAVVLGTAAALTTERLRVPGRAWLRLGMLASLIVPPFVIASGWTRAFGPHGLTDRLAGLELPGLYGPLGIVLVLSAAATPLAYLIVAGALATRVEPDLERAARASGAGPWTTFRTVTVPLLRRSLLAAGVVAFVFGLNAFGVPAVLGTPAGFATITTRLYQDLALSAEPSGFVRAITLAVTLVVVALAVVGAADQLLAGRGVERTATIAGAAGNRWGGRAAATVMGLLLAIAVGVPLVALVLGALTKAAGLPPVPEHWTLANFADALDSRFITGLVNSVVLATAAASVVLIIGTVGAVATRRGARVLGTAMALGFAVPGSALAIAVLLAHGGALRNTLAIILLAYVTKFWALGHRQVAGSLDRLPGDVLRAARVSGAGPLDTLRSVAIPILRPSLVAAWLIVFVFALHELTMSSLLYGAGTPTLAVVVLSVQELGDPTVSSALAVLLMAVVAAAAVPLAIWVGRDQRRSLT